MRALASPKRKLCSQFSNLSTLTTRKALRADLRSRITDKHPDIAWQAAERQGAAQRIWSFPAPLARTLRRSKTRARGERYAALRGQTLPASLPARTCPLRNGGNLPLIG